MNLINHKICSHSSCLVNFYFLYACFFCYLSYGWVDWIILNYQKKDLEAVKAHTNICDQTRKYKEKQCFYRFLEGKILAGFQGPFVRKLQLQYAMNF